MAEPTFNPIPEAHLPALRDLEALCRDMATKHGREALFALHAKSADELQDFLDAGNLKTIGHYLENAQRLILTSMIGESFAMVCIKSSRTTNRLLDLPSVLDAGEKLAEERLENHTAPALAKYCLSAWQAMEVVRKAPRVYFEEMLAVVAVALNRRGIQPEAAGEYATLGWNFSYRNGSEKLFTLNPKTGTIEPTQAGWDKLKEIEMGKRIPSASQADSVPPETYPYFFLRDGTKVLAESAEAKAEYERLSILAGYPVDRFNFYQVKGGLGERRNLPVSQVSNQKDADRIFRFICDGDSNWTAFLTQACKEIDSRYLPAGLLYHVNIERPKIEIQAAAVKLLEWNDGRLLSHAMANHLYCISAYSQMYGVFREKTPTALQQAIIFRSVDVAVWLLQMDSPRFPQTGVDFIALKKALVDIAHELNNKNAHEVLSRSRALFKIDSGIKPTQPQMPAMADPRRIAYRPLKGRGRTQVLNTEDGVRSIYEAFQQYQNGNDTYYLTEDDLETLRKFDIDIKEKVGRDRLCALLIRSGIADYQELDAPGIFAYLREHFEVKLTDIPKESKMSDDLIFKERIGMGGSAHVWKAHDTTLDRMVAVRLLMAADEGSKIHAQTLARAKHQNIVEVHHLVNVQHPETGASVLGIVLEYIDGKTVEELVNSVTLPMTELHRIGAALLSGIQHLHSIDLPHGDIHEGNILVTAQAVKILDLANYDLSLSTLSIETRKLRDLENLWRVLVRLLHNSELDQLEVARQLAKGQKFAKIEGVRSAFERIARVTDMGVTPSSTIATVDLREIPDILFRVLQTNSYTDVNLEARILGGRAKSIECHVLAKEVVISRQTVPYLSDQETFKILMRFPVDSGEPGKIRNAPVPDCIIRTEYTSAQEVRVRIEQAFSWTNRSQFPIIGPATRYFFFEGAWIALK